MPAGNFAPSWSVFATSLPRPVSLLRCSRCTDQSPPCQRGVPRLAEAGGFRRQSLRNFLPIPSSLFTKKPSPFHMGSYFGKVPPVESPSHGYAVPAPTGREPAGSARGQFRTKLVCIRHFPAPPGIVTGQNGERKYPHCARIDSVGTPHLWDAVQKRCLLQNSHFATGTFLYWE